MPVAEGPDRGPLRFTGFEERNVTSPCTTQNLGFLSIVHEPNGYVGGYLVTNFWGRPLEFRVSSAVQPNRIQQILYGETLQPYICADLIGKTLVEKTASQARLILTDCEAALDLRQRLEVPLVGVSSCGNRLIERPSAWSEHLLLERERAGFQCHPRFATDEAAAREVLERLDEGMDLAEPFSRVREAIAEARKMGVASRG